MTRTRPSTRFRTVPAAALAAVTTTALLVSGPAAHAGTRHPIPPGDVVQKAAISTLGWSPRGAQDTTYEDLGTSQSTLEPCQRTSLYAASGGDDVYTAQIYDRHQAFAGESVTQSASFGSAKGLARRLGRQIGGCRGWVSTHESSTPVRGGTLAWDRLRNRHDHTTVVAAVIRSGKRVALVGLDPQRPLTDARVDAFLHRALLRLR